MIHLPNRRSSFSKPLLLHDALTRDCRKLSVLFAGLRYLFSLAFLFRNSCVLLFDQPLLKHQFLGIDLGSILTEENQRFLNDVWSMKSQERLLAVHQ